MGVGGGGGGGWGEGGQVLMDATRTPHEWELVVPGI